MVISLIKMEETLLRIIFLKYRISDHPDFITYNKEKIRSHKDADIRKLAEELP